jgi:hypothetical protein
MKKNMSRLFTARAAALAVVLSFNAITKLSAQGIVPATKPDVGIGNFGYTNVATIEYGGIGHPQLTAIVQDEGPGGVGPVLFVNDQTTPWAPSATLPAPAGSAPDVIVGNNTLVPGDYWVAVVATVGSQVRLFTYDISNVGTGGLTVTLINSTTLSTNATGAAHIDAVAKYSTPYSGLPLVDEFAVIWKDNSMGIVAYHGNLNSSGGASTQVLNPSTHMSFPDVAAVERYNQATGTYESFALASYIDHFGSPDKLYYQEWHISAAPSTPILYDNANIYNLTYASGVTPIRIDAIDDASSNRPGGGNANFVITGAVTAHAGKAIVEYNDKTGPLVANDITSPVTGISGRTNILPVVACGPGKFYTVGYFTSGQNYYATSIDWLTGQPTSDPNAYEIPKNAFVPMGPATGPWYYGMGLAATCNNDVPGAQNLVSSFENGGVLYVKSTNAAAPYGFKHNAGQAPTAASNTEWVVAPNPANDFVVLAAPSGFNPGEHTTYRLQDITGRVVATGAIKNTSETIALGDLTLGMYFLNVYNDKSIVKTIKVVKQ